MSTEDYYYVGLAFLDRFTRATEWLSTADIEVLSELVDESDEELERPQLVRALREPTLDQCTGVIPPYGQWVNVDSSNLSRIAHNGHQLFVWFRGAGEDPYMYTQHPHKLIPDVFWECVSAGNGGPLYGGSAGKYFNAQIKGRMECWRPQDVDFIWME